MQTAIPFTNSSGYSFRLEKHSPAGTCAQVLLDSILGYLLQYVRYQEQDNLFSVNSRTGAISTQVDFDYELHAVEHVFDSVNVYPAVQQEVYPNFSAQPIEGS